MPLACFAIAAVTSLVFQKLCFRNRDQTTAHILPNTAVVAARRAVLVSWSGHEPRKLERPAHLPIVSRSARHPKHLSPPEQHKEPELIRFRKFLEHLKHPKPPLNSTNSLNSLNFFGHLKVLLSPNRHTDEYLEGLRIRHLQAEAEAICWLRMTTMANTTRKQRLGSLLLSYTLFGCRKMWSTQQDILLKESCGLLLSVPSLAPFSLPLWHCHHRRSFWSSSVCKSTRVDWRLVQ